MTRDGVGKNFISTIFFICNPFLRKQSAPTYSLRGYLSRFISLLLNPLRCPSENGQTCARLPPGFFLDRCVRRNLSVRLRYPSSVRRRSTARHAPAETPCQSPQ